MKTRDKNGTVVVKKHTGYTTDIITDKAIDWLKNRRDTGKPFMLMCQHKAPHRNWQPGPKYLNWLDDVDIPEPETLWDDYANRASPARSQAMTIRKHLSANDLKLTAPRNLTPEQRKAWDAAYGPKNKAFEQARATMSEKDLVKWKYQRYVKDYLRCVKSVDDGIGRILDYLDEAGLAKDTVVLYSSDQGWYLGEHGWYDKRWMYQESLKTPLLARWPGTTKPGSVNDALTSNLDFAETFLDLAGAPVPSDMQGRSLVPLLKGETPADWRKSFYYHYYEFPGAHSVARHYGVTDGRHKLIHYYQRKEWELFDLEKDPNELRSVYGQPAYSDVQQKLLAELTRLRRELKVPEEDPPSTFRGRRRRPSAKDGGKR
jgi:arylsulfatase A-like enzyme